jgi:hypothetical protein
LWSNSRELPPAVSADLLAAAADAALAAGNLPLQVRRDLEQASAHGLLQCDDGDVALPAFLCPQHLAAALLVLMHCRVCTGIPCLKYAAAAEAWTTPGSRQRAAAASWLPRPHLAQVVAVINDRHGEPTACIEIAGGSQATEAAVGRGCFRHRSCEVLTFPTAREVCASDDSDQWYLCNGCHRFERQGTLAKAALRGAAAASPLAAAGAEGDGCFEGDAPAHPSAAVPAHVAEECDHCGSVPGVGRRTRRCTDCYVVQYCSRECQAAAWGEHRALCHAVRAGVAADFGLAPGTSSAAGGEAGSSVQEPQAPLPPAAQAAAAAGGHAAPIPLHAAVSKFKPLASCTPGELRDLVIGLRARNAELRSSGLLVPRGTAAAAHCRRGRKRRSLRSCAETCSLITDLDNLLLELCRKHRWLRSCVAVALRHVQYTHKSIEDF